MTYKNSDINFSIAADFPAVYTGAHFFSGIPLIKSIILKNIPDSLCANLKISIVGKSAADEVVSFELKKDIFSFGTAVLPNSDTAIINLEKYRIRPDADFMHKLSINTTVRLHITVCIGEASVSSISNVRISPIGHVCPEMPPELLCTYVLPDCEFAQNAEKELSERSKKIAEKRSVQTPKPLLYAEALAGTMQASKLTYSALHREMLDGDCIIRDPDSLAESNKKSMSLTEAALLYCSCAERCGLRPGIVFLRKGAGSVKVLISIGLGDYYAGSAVSESIFELRERILSREIFIFDVLGLLGTEDTDFARNVTETTNLVLRSSSTLAFAVDVYTSRLAGVASLRPFDGAVAKDIYGGYESIGDAIKRIDKNAKAVTVYGYSPYSRTSLGICIPAYEPEFGSELTLCPLDDELICQEADSFLAFSDFRPTNLAEHPRNNTEQTVFETRLRELLSKTSAALGKDSLYVYPMKYMLSGDKLSPERVRDEVYSDAAKLSSNVKTDSLRGGNSKLYAAAGIVTIKENDSIYYAPCAYIPCEFIFETGALKLRFGVGDTVFNRSLAEYAETVSGISYSAHRAAFSDSDSTEALHSSKNQEIRLCMETYRKICEEYPETFSFRHDTIISNYDLSYTLMRDCLENADGKKFEQYLESGKYIPDESQTKPFGRFESTLPFEVPSDAGKAVRIAENNSVVISGVHGTGKKKTVGNIIARAALADEDVLVCSKYSESLEALYGVMGDKGLSELCLMVSDAATTKDIILSDIDKMSEIPGYPQDSGNTDAAISEHGLAVYADDIYSEFGFGYSLYDCVNEYCRLNLICSDTPIEFSAEIRDLSKENVQKMFSLTDRLTEKASAIYGMCTSGTADVSKYLKHIRNTSEISGNISSLFEQTEALLIEFAEKSAFARSCLGMSDGMICDVRTLLSFGEFLELIMKSGIDFLPDELLAGSTYKSAKSIEKACDIIDEICEINSGLTNVSDRIVSISCTELHIKWRDSENNPFVKNSIAHEIKKYLPEKTKVGSKEIDELLEKLAKREQLETELSYLDAEVRTSLGSIWQGTKTDTECARRVAFFALSADICIKKLFRNTADSIVLQSGIAKLIHAISEDDGIKSEFVLAVGAFRKLSSDNGGFFNELSKELCADLYELRFESGILGSNGMAKMLRLFRDNPEPIFSVHELNSVKKEAVAAGLSEAVSYIENNHVDNNTRNLIYKSLYLSFAKYIISSKTHLEGNALFDKYKKYREAYDAEKKLACYNLISAHRTKFRDYISDDEGKNELYALRETLCSDSSTVLDILRKHRKILKAMYSALLVPDSVAYRLEVCPSTLVLFDCEKTDATEGLPLCANFNKCIFITSPIERIGSVISSLPLGIPVIKLNKVLFEKNGNVALFAGSLFRDSVGTFCPERSGESIKFVKCSGGLYDKNTGANRIEALQVCETAYCAAREYGFDKVGIIAMTPAQTSEVLNGLELLSNKYKNPDIAKIPTRFIGNIGDFSKDCIILSVTFGKNIYSITRSFGIADDISLIHSGSPVCLCELLGCGKTLVAVSSVEPEDVMTDSLCKGANAVSALLYFAKYSAISTDIRTDSEGDFRSGIEEYLCKRTIAKDENNAARCFDGIITCNDNALIYEKGYVKDVYDRILLPWREAEMRGYNTEFSDICELIRN